jgi:hypothetical protein
MSSRSHNADYIDRDFPAEVSTRPEHLPDVVPFTARALHDAREAGWTVAEHRTCGWTYLAISRRAQRSVYKLVGPHFDRDGHHYCGYRTLIITASDA